MNYTQNETAVVDQGSLKWPEVWTLAALNAAIVISWIAYHEYQPQLLQRFELGNLTALLIIAKALVLVLIPPLAGEIADRVLRKGGKYFLVFSAGIGITAMIFMAVASIINFGPDSAISGFLPVMIVLWLISMNIFQGPANSMIEMFAPAQKLPIVMGVMVLITELLFALEPILVNIVNYLGDTTTFIAGGLLIGVTGWLFNRISSDDVLDRKEKTLAEEAKKMGGSSFLRVVGIGILVGLSHALVATYFPLKLNQDFSGSLPFGWSGEYLSSLLLGMAAIIAFPLSIQVSKYGPEKSLRYAFIGAGIGVLLLLFGFNLNLLLIGGVIMALSFSVAGVSGLPFIIQGLSLRHLTLGVGVYIGASEIFDGLLDILYNL